MSVLIASSFLFQQETYASEGGNHGPLGNPPENPKYPPESPVNIFITYMEKNVCLTICQYMHSNMLCTSCIKQFLA